MTLPFARQLASWARSRAGSRLVLAWLVLMVASLGLAVTAGEASAHSSVEPNWEAKVPRTGVSILKASPRIYGAKGTWHRGSGGDTPASSGFSYTRSEMGEKARWYLGDVQGEFRLWVQVPGDGAKPSPTAKVIYTVWEKRVDEDHYHRVRTYRLDQATRRGWRSFQTTATLDGRAMIRVERQDGGSGVMAAAGARLERVDVLPELQAIAERACQRDAAAAAVTSADGAAGVYPRWRELRALLDHRLLAAVSAAERLGADALRPPAAAHGVAKALSLSGLPRLPSVAPSTWQPGPQMTVDRAVKLLLAAYGWAEAQAKGPEWLRSSSRYISYLAQCRHHDEDDSIRRYRFHGYGEFAEGLAWASQQRRLGSKR